MIFPEIFHNRIEHSHGLSRIMDNQNPEGGLFYISLIMNIAFIMDLKLMESYTDINWIIGDNQG